MIRKVCAAFMICFLLPGLFGCGGEGEGENVNSSGIRERLKKYAPFEITVPWNLLDENRKEALEKLCLAATVMDELFLVQVYDGNPVLRDRIAGMNDPDLERYFRINFGPWDRLGKDEPFFGDEQKTDGANFYPADMTREEFERSVAASPGEKESFESNFTVIRRSADGGLEAVPYSREYRSKLIAAAGYLNEAAGLLENVSLARFLRSRAEAFLSNDYYESDMAWMDVKDNILDVTIGPYEVYEDNIFNYKAAFEAFICVRDPEESRRLEGLKGYLLKMEKNLPIDDGYKNLNRGTESPISVVDVVFTAGDTKAGVQTLAFNLPNDERVREAKGSKKVMLRNIIEAKFEKVLRPIAGNIIAKEQLSLVTFDAYYNHILLHEFTHGLGPGRITLPDGTETTVNKMLRETYSAIEEAKADVGGQYNFYYLIDEGFFPRGLREQTAVTFLAGFFRSVRFGVESAHGRANMIAFNYFKEKGAYVQDPGTGMWSVDLEKTRGAVRDLFRELLMLQAHGDYEGCKSFIERYGGMGEDVKQSLARLDDVPVDIEPVFEIERTARR